MDDPIRRNPYSPPIARVEDAGPISAAERPLLVWLIIVYHALGLAVAASLKIAVAAALFVLPPAYLRVIGSDGISGQFGLAAALMVVWLIQLYRLRRSAVYIVTILIAFRAALFARNWFTGVHAPHPALVGSVIGVSLNLAICAYAWSLWRKGVLK